MNWLNGRNAKSSAMRKQQYIDRERAEVAQTRKNCHHQADQQTPLRSQNPLTFSRKPSSEPGNDPESVK